MSRDDGSFLARWSRRKAAVRAGDLVPKGEPQSRPETSAAPAPAAVDDAVNEDELSDAELLKRYALPDPENLTADDGVEAFMRAGVPARLRRLALRRLWQVNPGIVAHDGLTDYAEDYTDAATVVADMKTVFQLGHGARPRLEQALETLERVAGPDPSVEQEVGHETGAEATVTGPADPTPPEEPPAVQLPTPAIDPVPAASAPQTATPSTTATPRRRSRMTFRPPGGSDED